MNAENPFLQKGRGETSHYTSIEEAKIDHMIMANAMGRAKEEISGADPDSRSTIEHIITNLERDIETALAYIIDEFNPEPGKELLH